MNLARPAPPLADELVRLDPLSHAFLEDMQSLGKDRDVILHTYVEEPFGADDAIVWLARYIQGWQDESCAGFAIVDAASDGFLGFCALVGIDREGLDAEIGYITAPAARGRGIATRALVLISDWGPHRGRTAARGAEDRSRESGLPAGGRTIRLHERGHAPLGPLQAGASDRLPRLCANRMRTSRVYRWLTAARFELRAPVEYSLPVAEHNEGSPTGGNRR